MSRKSLSRKMRSMLFLQAAGRIRMADWQRTGFFLTHTEKAERAAFLKDRYGVGGSSHALSRADNSHASYDGRGLELARGIYGKPDALVKLNWNQAAERVAKLIDQSLYLKPADYSRMPSYEREQMANRVIGFYHRLPDEVERPFKRELLMRMPERNCPPCWLTRNRRRASGKDGCSTSFRALDYPGICGKNLELFLKRERKTFLWIIHLAKPGKNL